MLKHLKSSHETETAAAKSKDLFESDSPTEHPIWLVVTTKKHIVPQKRLKPSKVVLPHSIYTSPQLSICLITPDPQRTFKDIVADSSFPTALSSQIKRVIDIKKLAAKYHSFESKRLLMDSHDLFFADDRIITYLPKILGKTFYNTTSKRPIPVRLQAVKNKEEREKKNAALPSMKPRKVPSDSKSVATPTQVAHEIERTLSMTMINLSSSATTAIRVGLSTFSPEQLTANIEAVTTAVIEKVIPKKWKGVKSIHVKGPNTMALPIWLAEELWEDQTQVLEDHQAEQARIDGLSKKKRKRLLEDSPKADTSSTKLVEDNPERSLEKKKRKRVQEDDGMSKEMKKRRELLRKQRREIEEQLNVG